MGFLSLVSDRSPSQTGSSQRRLLLLTKLIKALPQHSGFGARVALLVVWPCVSGPFLSLPPPWQEGAQRLQALVPAAPTCVGRGGAHFPAGFPGPLWLCWAPWPKEQSARRGRLPRVPRAETERRPSLPGQTLGCLENPHLCRVR